MVMSRREKKKARKAEKKKQAILAAQEKAKLDEIAGKSRVKRSADK